MKRRQLAARSLFLSALAVVLLSGAGCGSSTPEPEVPPVEGRRSEAPAAEREVPRVEQRFSSGAIRNSSAPAAVAAVLRTYLAERFLYASWYPSVGNIEVSRGTAIVSSWHLGRGSSATATAEQICGALLRSRRVVGVKVRYGRGEIVACP